jgi:hypothetical protein
MRTRLDPRYWGGNVLGDGSGDRPDKFIASIRVGVRALGTMNESLRQRVDDGPSRQPESPVTFRAEDYPVGTLVTMDKERLFRHGQGSTYADMSLFRGAAEGPAPEAPDRLAVDLDAPSGYAEREQAMTGAGIEYRREGRLGVVGLDDAGTRRLLTIHSFAVRSTESGLQIASHHPFKSEPAAIPLGQTLQFTGPGWMDASLERTNTLDIIRLGDEA